MFTWTFLLRITHTITSRSLADSSWITLYVWYLSQYLLKFLMRNLFLHMKRPSRGNPHHTARRVSTSISVLDRGLNDVLFFCVVSSISSGLYWYRRKQLMEYVLIGEVRDRNYCRSDSLPTLMLSRPMWGWCNITSGFEHKSPSACTQILVNLRNICACFLFVPNFFWLTSEIFSILRRNERDMVIKTSISLHVKYPLFLSDFNETWIFSTDFQKILKYQFNENPSIVSRIVPRVQTDRHDEADSHFAIIRRRLGAFV